jgi:gliding motility-associated-like protein
VLPAPVIGETKQPVFSDPTGSVELTGLPAGAWVLTRMPGQVTTSGSGTTFLVKPLPIGEYTFTISDATHCTSPPSEMVKISPPGDPELIITDPPTVCSPATVNLEDPSITEGSTSGIIYTYWIDTLATIPYPDYTEAVAGKYFIKGTNASGFFTIGPVIVTVDEMPVANAGPDQFISNIYTATLDAELAGSETGVWIVDTGTGIVSDTLNPKSDITNLSSGENIILWKVINGVCPADTDNVILTVGDIIIPTLITPNGDTKNEYFVILGIESLGKTELIIFDRRGSQVFKNTDYDNKWNGVDYNENPLPNDTYFFVINSAKGRIVKGYIVIRR